LAVSNGPNTFCQYGRAPYLLFKQLIDDPELRFQASEWIYWRALRLRKGEQWPWASPLQRLTWKDDTAEHIAEEFVELEKTLLRPGVLGEDRPPLGALDDTDESPRGVLRAR